MSFVVSVLLTARPALSQISVPQNQEIGAFYVDQKRLDTDFEALKSWAGRWGACKLFVYYTIKRE